ncbi:hypothetical protein [Pelagibacterium montanilacus]|uniref:hypothetical protein n=1 Tax=Pelagibacterium montanilacus TaxID=2185280 RepID=UPI000F8F2EC4|nr:hypothetical protein [Pelagibacterium montanilacus]
MRFILRSAFWLGAAWLVMAPNHGPAGAASAGADLAASGRSLAEAFDPNACTSLECAAGRAAVTGLVGFVADRAGALASPPADPTPAPQPAEAPFPPPRPAWAS